MKHIAIFLIAVAAVLACIWHLRHESEATNSSSSMTSAGVMQLANAGQTTPVLNAPSPTKPVQAAPSPPKTAREKVALLSKSMNPQDQFYAYQMISACVVARKDDLLVADRVALGGKPKLKTSSQICGDIDAGQIASRRLPLQYAANAGVHHAASSLADEGPAGEGYSKDSDSSSAEQIQFETDMRQAIAAGAANGDWWSLAATAGARENSASTPEDFKEALKNLEDANAAYRKETGSDMTSYMENKGRLTYFSNQSKSNQ